jgi:hypothetical protein
MADRYWVGGSGTWSSTNITNWSATSGGAGGESVPTASDKVFFDANSGSSSNDCSIANDYTARCYSFSQVNPTLTLTTSGFSGFLEVGDTSGGLNCGDFSATKIFGLRTISIRGSTSGTPSVFSYAAGGPTALCLSLRFLTGSFVLIDPYLPIRPVVSIDAGATLDCTGCTWVNTQAIVVDNSATLIVTNATIETDRWEILGSATLTGSSSMTSLKIPSLSLSSLIIFSDARSSKSYSSVDFGGLAKVSALNGNLSITSLIISGTGVQISFETTIIAASISVVSPSTSPYARLFSTGGQFTLSSASATPIALNGLAISGCNATGGAVYTADVTSIDAGSNTGIQFANSPGFLAFFT